MATFILVPGAWHAGWCWERIEPLLRAAGHQVVAPDLPSVEPNVQPDETITLARWAEQIAALAVELAEPVILVGHSRGGVVISEAAERAPQSIAALVYLCAYLVPSGQSMLALARKHSHQALLDAVVSDGVGLRVRADAAKAIFYNRTEESWAERALERLTPEPLGIFSTPLQLSPERFGTVPRVYIECTHDNAVPIDLQRRMHRDLPCDPVTTLESDHSPFYSAPKDLAEALIAIAARLGQDGSTFSSD